jgi:nicotinate-nucleotide pyrophosphorylase (carboxylating)|tara:strand:- start:1342 stop:2190 length:849 start_codon:yes stop_codon:yes gene_type:complete
MIITPDIDKLIDLAIMEDYSSGDATTQSLIPPDLPGEATLVSDEAGILAGLDISLKVFTKIDGNISITNTIADGSRLDEGSQIATISGPLGSILTAERTSLNFLRKLSGVATETGKYVKEIAHTNARIVDTRKTTPGFRTLEKYAVRMGGGLNHRQNLSDGILIKDNHRQTLSKHGLDLKNVILKAISNASHTIKVEIEVETIADVKIALDAGAGIIMLDNMSLSDMASAVALCKDKAITEASGGINLSSVKDVAETGVDLISVGAITHSAPNLDLSMDIKQ